MPRYDYRCASCENEFELVQTFMEAGKGACPACSGAGQRVFHAVPIIYKGSGFYTTDYGRPKQPSADKPPAENQSGSSDGSSSSSSGSSSDSKSKSDTAAKSTSDSTAKSSTESSSSSSSTSSTPASSS